MNTYPPLAALCLSLAVSMTASAQPTAFSSYTEVMSSDVPATILQRVIARDGKSKTYTDLLPLDGGTVGIAHFAVGGLSNLYREMNTQRFFAKPTKEMIAKYSSGCRPTGKSGDDTGWGCFSQKWWRQGMSAFLSSEDAKTVQNKAWARMMKPTIETALAHGWTTPRQLGIALSIANSSGSEGFQTLAGKLKWEAEPTLEAYASRSPHTARRRDALDSVYPR
ncbi:hypothetical protein GJ699_31875 [Duganella sp. FT80W]|uniref:Lysozyme n=1 Tax=Duganella guangzhouensis TaxID=2666084 RepID=A0A6I2LCS4_9BURK|nr:hypothetical protein [Duganella guangzhouensis]MRW94576.1 hypothetical protein [Duganella guangzhouensis]